jgi:hypothetical protein
MAVSVAQRAERYLNLPSTIITDSLTLETTDAQPYSFDNQIIVGADRSNYIKKSVWINKGRYRVFELSPYDDTIVLDTDYQINSRRLLETFEQPSDFVCPRTAKYILNWTAPNETMNSISLDTYWATIMRFKKTQRTEDLFTMIRKVQENYEYYSDIHNFMPYSYRNDYALTIALRAVNGHTERSQDFMRAPLYHVDTRSVVTRLTEEGDTSYRITKEVTIAGKSKQIYIKVKDFDFHVLDKVNFLEINS